MQALSFEEQVEISREMEIERLAALWRQRSAALKIAETEEISARAALVEACGGQDFEGKGVEVRQIVRKGTIEYSAIPELADVDLEDYRKPASSYWMVKPSVKE